jgi:putative oxidoreductase
MAFENTRIYTSSDSTSRVSLDDAGKLLLRLTVAALMLFHGIDKVVHGIAGIQRIMVRNGFPEQMAYGVYLGEIVAPLLIIVGLWTRSAALLYAFTVVFATALVHAADYAIVRPNGAYGGELWLFYIVGALAVALLGAGRYSVTSAKVRHIGRTIKRHFAAKLVGRV